MSCYRTLGTDGKALLSSGKVGEASKHVSGRPYDDIFQGVQQSGRFCSYVSYIAMRVSPSNVKMFSAQVAVYSSFGAAFPLTHESCDQASPLSPDLNLKPPGAL